MNNKDELYLLDEALEYLNEYKVSTVGVKKDKLEKSIKNSKQLHKAEETGKVVY